MSSQSNVTPGPIALENNPPIRPEYYSPRERTISAINLGSTTLITTLLDNEFVVGQLIRLIIPSFYGSFQLNGRSGYVIEKPASNQVVVDINSNDSSPFISNPTYGSTIPQILPIGDINTGVINIGRTGNQTYIDGSFINISPL